MPKIKIDSVISFSSEDPVYVANNILSNDPTKKWKCRTPGEKSAVIVLQLEKASVISSIDIGNEHSAYIEILVSRSSLNNDDYKVFLVMSSFMTPTESKQSTNINKVRMFTKDDFSKPENEQKWDRVKIVCTQPFNRHVQYGLSFVTFHALESNNNPNNGAIQQTFGKFTLRPDSPDNLSVGSLFARRKESQSEQLSAAAQIREASASNTPITKPKLKLNTPSTSTDKENNKNDTKTRNRDEILYDKDDDEPNKRIDTLVEMKRKEKQTIEARKEKDDKKKTPKKTKNNETNDEVYKRASSSSVESKKKKIKIVEKQRETRPFSQLLKDVVLVISGIQNPDRANLRTSALAMGAKYKPDWGDSCTHLICAFPNTPKFNQVRGHGKIVKRAWIEDCYSQRKRLPWRRYALDKNDVGEESEEEIWERIDEPVNIGNDNDNVEEFDDDMEERIAELKKQNINPYNLDTDDEDLTTNSKEITDKLLDIFDKQRFYIDDNLDSAIYKLAKRYIIAYKGVVTKNKQDVDIFITTEDNVSKLRNDTAGSTVFIKPDWIWECHNSQTFLQFDDYKIE